MKNMPVVDRAPTGELTTTFAFVDARDDERKPAAVSSLFNLAVILWRCRRALTGTTIAGTLLTLLIVCLVPNRYESTTRLMSPEMRGSNSEAALVAGLLSKSGGGMGGLASDLFGTSNAGDVLVGVLHSRSLGEALVKKFDLQHVYRAHSEEIALDRLTQQTNISQERKSGIISISVTDQDPSRAAALACAYVEAMNQRLAEVNTSAAHRERVFIEERKKSAKQDLGLATRRLSDFATENLALDPKEQGKAALASVAKLQSELNAGEIELDWLRQRYADAHPDIDPLKTRVQELRRKLANVRDTGRETSVSPGGDSYPSVRKLPSLEAAYADLYRDVKLQETVFETLTQQYELAKIAEAKELPVVKILDPANLPGTKSGPPRLIVTAFGAVFAFAAAAVVLVFGAWWNLLAADDPRRQFAREIYDSARPLYARVRGVVPKSGVAPEIRP